MEEALGEYKIDASDFSGDLKLEGNAIFFFVGDDKKVTVYKKPTTATDAKQSLGIKFESDKKRHICIENFLAFHSREIGTHSHTGPLSGSVDNETKAQEEVLHLTFNGDEEVYHALVAPEEHHGNMSWKTVAEFEGMKKALVEQAVAQKKNAELTIVLLDVKQRDDTLTLFVAPFFIHAFQMFAEVLLPWVVKNRYNQPMMVELSCLQKEMFLDKGLQVDFYPVPNGPSGGEETSLEPIILSKDAKLAMFSEIARRFLDKQKQEADDAALPIGTTSAQGATSAQEKDHTIVTLTFKNGDRDVVNAFCAGLNYPFAQKVTLDSLAGHPRFDHISELAKTSERGVVIVKTLVPVGKQSGSEKEEEAVLYEGILKIVEKVE